MTNEVDVVVAGAGLAGVTAALRLAERGVSVAVIERRLSEPCNTAISGGVLYAAGTDLQETAGVADDAQRYVDDLLRKNHGECDETLVRAIVGAGTQWMSWVVNDLGIGIRLAPEIHRTGHSVVRAHVVATGGGGSGILRELRKLLFALPNVTVLDQAEVTSLESNGAAGWTVMYSGARSSAEQSVTCTDVVLATGGFGADPELLDRFCPSVLGYTHIGSSANQGTAVRCGSTVGGALTRMASFQGHGHVIKGRGTRLNPGIPLEGGVLLNDDGARFCPIDVGYSELTTYLRDQPEGEAWEIFDRGILDIVGNTSMMLEATAANSYRMAEDVDGLAAVTGISAEVLTRELADHQEAYRAFVATERPDLPGHVLEPPYYAGKIIPGLAQTLGGLVIDTYACAQRADGTDLPGLYACGCAAGGISGESANGYLPGNGLMTAFGTGWLAAEAIAA